MAKKLPTETMILDISDIQFGRTTKDYNPDRVRGFFRNITQKVIAVKRAFNDRVFDSLVLLYLGDIADGINCFPKQGTVNNLSGREQVNLLAQYLDEYLHRPLAQEFGKLLIVGVPGDHGPTSKNAHSDDNWDLFLYDKWSDRYQSDPLIHCDFSHLAVPSPSKKDEWVAIKGYEIHKWRFLLYHGHHIDNWSTTPLNAIVTSVMKWSINIGPFNVVNLADKHLSFYHPIKHDLHIFLNGTMLIGDEWGTSTIKTPSSNYWWLYGCNRQKPVTFVQPIEVARPSPFTYKKLI